MIDNTFGINIIPENDTERLNALKRYRILDTPAENSFDNIAELATKIFNVPISLVSLVDAERVFFKANAGMGKARESSRGKSLCALAVLNPDVTVFEDALKEPCLMVNPNVAGDFGLRFYAGAPLATHDGFLIGTLCIIDKKPRKFTKSEEAILKGLATAVMDQVELRLSALNEHDQQQLIHEELISQREETYAINEELSATNEEISESRQNLVELNEILTESESRFRSLIAQSPVAIATLKGRELVIDCANDMILNIWGKDRSIIGRPLHLALPELEGQPFLAILDEVFTSGRPYHGKEVKVALKQHGILTDVYLNFVYQPITGIDVATRDIMVVANDVTAQVDSRKIIELAEEKFRLIADNISQLAWMADETGSIFWYNRRWFAYTGTTLQEMRGWGWQKVHHPDHVERVAEKIGRHFKSGEIWEDVFPIKSHTGEYRWFLSRAVPVADEAGQVISWFGTNTDITEQHKLEERKDDFLSIASHELKTPITSLKASLQLLGKIKEKPFTPMHTRLIDQANQSMEKLNMLVDELLNVNRLTEGQLQVNKNNFKITAMLDDCCTHVRAEGKYNLIVQGDRDLSIYADENRVEQIIVNFVNNAVKYAPGSYDIYLDIKKMDGAVKISVTDNGPGIADDNIPHIFERYYRADYSGKNYTGLGLGLYISSEIVKKHGGQIGVNSKLGEGSTFWFTLPLLNN